MRSGDSWRWDLLGIALGVFGLGVGCGRLPNEEVLRTQPERRKSSVTPGTSAPPLRAAAILINSEAPSCGDGDLQGSELCDDGNQQSGDGCSVDCRRVEPGFACRVPGGSCERIRYCGDGRQTSGEQCDDGNAQSGDGCTDTCLLEKDYACPTPGAACHIIGACGDSLVQGAERCDDGNVSSGDGCDAQCILEPGWTCEQAGAPCRPVCGDGRVTGAEYCDDGNHLAGDGCTASCGLEPGWVCDGGQSCRQTVCGDGKAEGIEPCDDGDDLIVGDGCSPGCNLEPVCVEGVCSSQCGDGLTLAGDQEECDDGNDQSGDGCSSDCKLEVGWVCQMSTPDPPRELELPILFRDFVHKPVAASHPDFERYSGDATTPGLVGARLAADGKPVYTGLCEAGQILNPVACPFGEQTTSKMHFDEWYRDAASNIGHLGSLTFQRQADGTFVFDSGAGLFPLNNQGWVARGIEETSAEANYNYGFTSELRYWFEYSGGEFLEFSGDDDVWVFIGGQLIVDIGGLHPRTVRGVMLNDETAAGLGLEKGRVYEIALFHAERHTYESNFRLTLKGFGGDRTECQTTCGDGIRAGSEACDDGAENGRGYGFCTVDCEVGPRCGDGILNPGSPEVCDNGLNLDAYNVGPDACSPGCKKPPYCGDGLLDAAFGEECDDGQNLGHYGGCASDCTLGPRCGDGVLQGDEECDDGNRQNDDRCDTECKILHLSVVQ